MSTPSQKTSRPDNSQKRSTTRRRRYLFRLIAILLGLLPFVLLELMLTALDVGRPEELEDPFVGFSSIHPLFELNERDNAYVTAQSRQLYFGKQRFPARKPKNGFRIFCLGGSTVRGRPHDTGTAFSQWLEIELNGRDPGRGYQVVNCGGVSYASHRLRPVLDEVLGYEPDLIVLAAGHNEFLEDRTYHELKSRSRARRWITDQVYSLRTVTVARRMFGAKPSDRVVLSPKLRARLDNASGYELFTRDDENWRAVIASYRVNVEAMVRACQEKNVPIFVVNLGSNLRDCPPFKSMHKPGLSDDDERAWRDDCFDPGFERELTARNDPGQAWTALKEALAHYRRAEALDDEHGLLLYRIARVLDRLGRHDAARAYYLKARDWDVCPLRMKEEMHEILHDAASDKNVPLVDVRARLEQLAPRRMPGFDWYVDHVHPTIAGHQIIAQRLFDEMQRRGQLSNGARAWTEKQRRDAYREHFAQLSPTEMLKSKKFITFLEKWARRAEVAEEIKPFDAAGYLRLGNRHLEIGRRDDARAAFSTASESDRESARELLEIGLSYVRQGRPQAAQTVVDCLTEHARPKETDKRLLLLSLIVAVEQRRNDETVRYYQRYRQAPLKIESLGEHWQSPATNALRRAAELSEGGD